MTDAQPSDSTDGSFLTTAWREAMRCTTWAARRGAWWAGGQEDWQWVPEELVRAHLDAERECDRDDDGQALGDGRDCERDAHGEHVEDALAPKRDAVEDDAADDAEGYGREALPELVHSRLQRRLALVRLVEHGAHVAQLRRHGGRDDDAGAPPGPHERPHECAVRPLSDGQRSGGRERRTDRGDGHDRVAGPSAALPITPLHERSVTGHLGDGFVLAREARLVDSEVDSRQEAQVGRHAVADG